MIIRSLTIGFVSMLAVAQAPIALSQEWVTPVTITGKQEIAQLRAVSLAIDAVSEKVMECIDAGLAPPTECVCLYPAKMKVLKQRFEAAVLSHPEWASEALTWHEDGVSQSLNMPMISSQVAHECY